MRLLALGFGLLSALGLGACGGSPFDDRGGEVLERAAYLFQNYGAATAKQDQHALGVLRGDLRRLNTEAFDRLLAALASKDLEVQGYAAFVLGFSANRAAMAPLAAATGHADETLRGIAIAALGQLGFPDTPMEPFHRLVVDPVAEVRHATLFGLSFLVAEKDDRGMMAEIHAALADPEPNVRNEALIVIGKMRLKESVAAILEKSIKDPVPRVRAGAALALSGIGTEAKEATPFLVELLKDEVHRVVECAWTALNKIHQKDFDRSYATWRDWYEDEQKIHYTCLEHKEVSELKPGLCPKCRKQLERQSKEGLRRIEPAPASISGLFVCPDHAEIVTTTAAKCGKPGCGKDLVPRKPDPMIYACPDHPEILTTTPAKCGKPGCGKDLLPKK